MRGDTLKELVGKAVALTLDGKNSLEYHGRVSEYDSEFIKLSPFSIFYDRDRETISESEKTIQRMFREHDSGGSDNFVILARRNIREIKKSSYDI